MIENTENAYVSDLTNYNEVPKWMKHEFRFITRGFRINHSIFDLVKSVFRKHNETINIWSHGMTFIIYFIVLFYQTDIFMTILCICYVICFMLSTVLHVLDHYSYEMDQSCMKLDWIGIVFAVYGSSLQIVYKFSHVHVYFFTFISMLCVYVLLFGKVHQNGSKWTKTLLVQSVGLYPFTVFYLSTVQSYHMQFAMFTILLGSIVFYACKIPERFIRNRFDYIGASHQLWHLTSMICSFIMFDLNRQLALI